MLILFLGNICRSPIADGVFQHLVKQRGIADQWEVDSAAIGGWHVGKLPDSRARSVLKKYNIEYNGRARQVFIVQFFFCFPPFFLLVGNRICIYIFNRMFRIKL